MKKILFYLVIIFIISFSNSLPHFIFDGIKSSHKCIKEKSQLSFSIFGTLTEKANLRKIRIHDYLIDDIGLFKCSFSENEDQLNEKRKQKIVCSITGQFRRNGYILEEPKVYGFDFMTEEGVSSWPKIPEKKTFLIGECGEEIELENEPILLSDSTSYSNPLEMVRKGIVDKALAELPKRETINESGMCSLMKNLQQKYSFNEAESAYFVYKWLGENIAYDCYSYVHGGINYSESYAYTEGKGVCNSYSLIFNTMCKTLGLEVVQIVGYSKGASFVDGKIPTKTDHAWNAVKIDSKYYLIDSTWGTGYCNGDVFNKNFNDLYFCTNPEIFIRKHLPADSKWQLLTKIITIEEFVQMAKLSNGFYENGFISVYPDTNIITVEGKSKIIITYDANNDIKLIYHLFYVENNNSTEILNKCFYSKNNGKAEIDFITNKKGEYKLRIYGGPTGSKSFPHLIDYIITNTKEVDYSGFPKVYNLYSSSDMQIIEPLYNPLKKGTNVNFKIKTTTYDNLYVGNDGKNFVKLEKGSNGVFEKSVAITGNQVRISTLDKSYKPIVEYTTN